jgi:GTP cyclohydrolase IA
MEYDPGTTETTFASTSIDQIVCVSGLRMWSLCEHHLLPFWCDVSIGYAPDEKVLGLSKFARIAHQCAHRLQLQERLGQQIAEEISRITGTEDVAVVLKGEHYCMAARGIRTLGLMTSSTMRGVFRTHSETRMEFLRLIE